jgi:hypothetical protein
LLPRMNDDCCVRAGTGVEHAYNVGDVGDTAYGVDGVRARDAT